MKKKVIQAEQQGNGSLLTYEDGTQEFLDGVQVTVNKNTVAQDSDDEESALENLKRSM